MLHCSDFYLEHDPSNHLKQHLSLPISVFYAPDQEGFVGKYFSPGFLTKPKKMS